MAVRHVRVRKGEEGGTGEGDAAGSFGTCGEVSDVAEAEVAVAALQAFAPGTLGFVVSGSSAYTVKHIRKGLTLLFLNGGEWGMLKMDLGYPSAPGANAKRRSADKFRILRIDSIRRDTPIDVAIFFICRKI